MPPKVQQPDSVISVLFVDATGATLAPMAEALLRHMAGGKFRAESAGAAPAGQLDESCLALLRANAIPADGLACKSLSVFQTPERSVKIDIVVRLGNMVAGLPPQLYGVPAKVDWLVDDPAEAQTPEQAAWKAKKAFTTLQQRINELVTAKLPAAKGELQMAVQAIGKS
ncbi:MAG: hypothetical protein GC131_07575 [Alphaproteobacteria bacterium]|nr:hypothetical protein [Alphaproteobacteria bacterium]